jgi:hypothetical protein
MGKLKKLRAKAKAWPLVAKRRKFATEAAEIEQERRKLFERLMAEIKDTPYAKDPNGFLAFLKQQRRGYDPASDGASKLMQLVDDIAALDAVEQEWVKAQQPPTEGDSSAERNPDN